MKLHIYPPFYLHSLLPQLSGPLSGLATRVRPHFLAAGPWIKAASSLVT